MNDGIERAESFVYQGDKLNAVGRCLSAVTAMEREQVEKDKSKSGFTER